MPDPPSDSITFLFTDIEGSTRLLDALGEEYAAVLTEHQRLLRTAFAQHDGREIDTQGDAFFAMANDGNLANRTDIFKTTLHP